MTRKLSQTHRAEDAERRLGNVIEVRTINVSVPDELGYLQEGMLVAAMRRFMLRIRDGLEQYSSALC